MKVLSVTTIEELREYLQTTKGNFLYRGQTKHYGGINSPAMMSSFDRLGCIPDQMLRWSFYAIGALKFTLGHAVRSLPFSQAILQHYGFRSFFLDASSDPAVGAWFASHSYQNRMSVHLCEDCFEDPMFLRKPGAIYELEAGQGHFYLIDVDEVEQMGIGAHDLASIELKDCRPRFHAQSAWLLGPQRGNLPIECFHSRIIAPKNVLAEFAAEAGLTATSDLFPPPNLDPVLDALLHLPWQELKSVNGEGEIGIPAFRRTVEIPEYHDGFIKIHSPSHAFFRGEAIGEVWPKEGAELPRIAFTRVPPIIMLGHADPVGSRFPKLVAELAKEPLLAFEIDELIRLAETGPSETYGKGLMVTLKEATLVEVGDLVVDHPGMKLVGAGTSRGWHYTIEQDGRWTRITHPDDCPCGDDDRHRRHLSALTILEDWLNEPLRFTAEEA